MLVAKNEECSKKSVGISPDPELCYQLDKLGG